MFHAELATWHYGDMRRTDTEPDQERPPTCAAIDALLNDLDVKSRFIADHLGVNESTVSRWRERIEPDRETVLAIERLLELTPGTVGRMSGYVEDRDGMTMLERLEDDPKLTRSNRIAIVAAYKAGLEASKEELKQQSQWRSKRRSN